jgi:hypothetical protein
MAGLVPAIHVFEPQRRQDVDPRHKAGDDDPALVPGLSLDRVSPEQCANDLKRSACAAVQKQHALEGAFHLVEL